MLSSDKNVESIALLIQQLKEYAKLQNEYVKYDVVEKVVRLVTAFSMTVIVLILVVTVLFYLSFAAVYAIEPFTGLALAFFFVAIFFILLLLLVVSNRKRWIEQPLVRFLSELLID